MKNSKNLFLLSLMLGFLYFSCQDLSLNNPVEEVLNLPAEPFDYENLSIPDHMKGDFSRDHFNNSPFVVDEFIFSPQNPKITNQGATLGRVLFYDKNLSINNSVSCASCHRQELAFSDFSKGSVGFGGKVTPRNSMAIINVAVNNNLFWDSRVSSVKELILNPVQNHIEMGMESISNLEKKLAQKDYYKELFMQAYGVPNVTANRISDAMTQFLLSMTSTNSKFDQGVSNGFSNFTPLEKLGRDIFNSDIAKCSQCHASNNFSGPDSPGGEYGGPTIKGTANIGLDLSYQDNGLGKGKFRIPSLRNIALTGPYMHDGRFATLEEVIEHYNSGIKAHHALDKKLKNETGNPQKLNLTQIEKQALVAFLKTLTDESLTKDPKFSNPFN